MHCSEKMTLDYVVALVMCSDMIGSCSCLYIGKFNSPNNMCWMCYTHPLTIRLVGFREKEVQYLVGSEDIDFSSKSLTTAGSANLLTYKQFLKVFRALL
jgi:hypothetical protein